MSVNVDVRAGFEVGVIITTGTDSIGVFVETTLGVCAQEVTSKRRVTIK